jgi:hypothetical protein
MNTERLKSIEDITKGSPTRLRETYFKNNFEEIYISISEYTEQKDLPFVQKIWHWVNELPNNHLCKCGNKTTFNKNWKDGYRKSCSPKCAQSEEISKELRKKTTLEKWGVDNVSKNKLIREKTENTNLEKWGYKSTFSNSEVREKWKNTIREKYGVDHYFKTDEFKLKTKRYYLEKWGVEHQLNSEEVKERIKNTCLLRYGVSTYLNTEHSRSSVKKYNRSGYEDELVNWLISIGLNDEDIVKSDRKLLKPLLLDIYLPNYNLAIEFNGLYWHSEIFKSKDYHLNKTIGCNKHGIHLIHIWEDDWKNRKEVIKSIISNKLSKIKERIYARSCEIKRLNNSDCSVFLNKNHIQGYAKFSESYGLYKDNELVSVMSFGWRATNGKREYELIRFCNKLNTNVIGAASKLFNHFIKNNNIDKVISYADISMFDGSLYKTLNFKYTSRSSINYWWIVDGIRRHRFGYNKKKLVKMGYDPLKTEVEIMHELGNFRIFGCGQDKWIWERL